MTITKFLVRRLMKKEREQYGEQIVVFGALGYWRQRLKRGLIKGLPVSRAAPCKLCGEGPGLHPKLIATPASVTPSYPCFTNRATRNLGLFLADQNAGNLPEPQAACLMQGLRRREIIRGRANQPFFINRFISIK